MVRVEVVDVGKIGIFGHYGNLNLGDEAIIHAVIQSMKRLMPAAEICCFSINPDDSELRHGVRAFPIRRRQATASLTKDAIVARETGGLAGLKDFVKKIPLLKTVARAGNGLVSFMREIAEEWCFLKNSLIVLREFDVLMVSGSNQFLDNFGGSWGFPYTLLKWAIISRISGTRLFFVCIGAGPIESKLSLLFVRIALLFSDYSSYRDLNSKKLIETGFFSRLHSGLVYPDLAYSLPLAGVKGKKQPAAAEASSFVVGINPMPIYDSRYWHESDNAKYRSYVAKLANFTNYLQEMGHRTFFFPTMKKDENVINDVIDYLGVSSEVRDTMCMNCGTVEELMSVILSADIIVPTRFHGTVLSFLAGKPVVGVCYHRKTHDLLLQMGQGDYSVRLDELDLDDLKRKFDLLTNNYQAEKAKIEDIRDRYGFELEQQYSFLVGKCESIN